MAAEISSTTSTSTTLRDPEYYLRTTITQSAKGEYRRETVTAVTWSGPPDEFESHVRQLDAIADRTSREAIARREGEKETDGDDSAA